MDYRTQTDTGSEPRVCATSRHTAGCPLHETAASAVVGLGRGQRRPTNHSPRTHEHQQAACFVQEMPWVSRLSLKTLYRWENSARPHGAWGQTVDPASTPVTEVHCVLPMLGDN